jgi:hypothetical protein
MRVSALVKTSFITKDVLFQPFNFAVKIVPPCILSIYKTVLLSLEGKLWATIIHSVRAGTRNTDLKSSIKVKPTMGFSIWRNIKWNGNSILMNRTQVQVLEYFARRTERKLERETENMTDVPTNFLSRNKHCISNITIEREWRPQVYIWKININISGS